MLAGLGRGLTNRQLAAELFVSEKTVKTHVSNLLAKLRLTDRTQAALFAVRAGVADRGRDDFSPLSRLLAAAAAACLAAATAVYLAALGTSALAAVGGDLPAERPDGPRPGVENALFDARRAGAARRAVDRHRDPWPRVSVWSLVAAIAAVMAVALAHGPCHDSPSAPEAVSACRSMTDRGAQAGRRPGVPDSTPDAPPWPPRPNVFPSGHTTHRGGDRRGVPC